MAIPVEPDGPTWKFIAIGAGTIVTALFSWIAKGLRDEQKELGLRIDALERTYVTREELEKHLALLRADNLRMHQETRADNLRMHVDNQGLLQRIEDKVDRGSQTRHDIRDGVGTIQLMLRAALKKDAQE